MKPFNLSHLLVLVIAIGLLPGCGSSSGPAPFPSGPPDAAMQEAISAEDKAIDDAERSQK